MSMQIELTGKVAVVTGSSRGLGRTLARGLCRAGAHVVINGRKSEAVAATVSEFQKEGLSVSPAVFDITDEEQTREAVKQIIHDHRRIDILVNNAGRQIRAPLEEFALDSWKEIIDINLTGTFLMGKAVAPHMISRGSGKIVNICSLQSELGRKTIAPYAASKGGVKMLTRAMAVEWAEHNIQVNGIAPGYFLTEMTQPLADDQKFDGWVKGRTPAGRWGDPEELVGPLLLLVSEGSDFMNGHVIFVDGGMSIAV
jgi:gluconate 5-dehydrogenase